MLGLLDAYARQQGCCIAFGGVASHFGKFLLQFGHMDAILVAEVWLAVERVTFLHHLPHGGVSHQYGVEHGAVVILEVVLAQYAQSFTRSQFHASLGGFQFSADGLEEGGFSGTVGTDYSVDVAVGEFHVHVFVEDAFAKLYGDVGKCYHIFFVLWL